MGKEQQSALKDIKHILVRCPILHMPNHEGRFHLYLDTSKFTMGNTLYQIQKKRNQN